MEDCFPKEPWSTWLIAEKACQGAIRNARFLDILMAVCFIAKTNIHLPNEWPLKGNTTYRLCQQWDIYLIIIFFLFCHGFTNVNYLERVKSWKLPMWDKVYWYHCSDTVGIHCHPMVEVWIQKYNLKEHIVNVVLYKDTISHQWM